MKFEFMSGPQDGEQIEIKKDRVTFGRETINDISLPYAGKISATHLTIINEKDQFFLIDHGSDNTGSKNGTVIIYQNYERFEIKKGKQTPFHPSEKVPLQLGSIIILGETVWIKLLEK